MDLRTGIIQTAESLGIDPVDLATAISYETGGTFDPLKRGPTTQWGQHRGLIQFGEPQARQHGVDWNDPLGSQLGPQGAVASYLRGAGVKPGMGLLDVYSAINAGAPGLYNRSDANNGGAPGTVRDKVEQQMDAHRRKAAALLGMEWTPPARPAATGGQPMADQGRMPVMSTQGMPAQAPEPERKGLFNPDVRDRLIIALEGMTLNPNQALMANAQQGMQDRRQERRDDKAANRTAAFLEAQGRPDLAAAVMSGVLQGSDAASILFAPKDEKGQVMTAEMLRQMYPGSQIEDGLYNLKPDGTVSKVGGNGTTVNVGAGEGAFDKKTGEILATEAAEVAQQGAAAQRSMGQISALETALKASPGGLRAGLLGVASNMGLKTANASDIELADAVISQLVPQQRPPGSGTMSDADLALFRQSLPRLMNTTEGNRKIIATMKAIAEYDMKRGEIARRLQLGEIRPQDAFAAYAALGNPLADFSANNTTPEPTGSGILRFDENGNQIK